MLNTSIDPRIGEVETLMKANRLAEAEPLLSAVVADQPNVADLRRSLGLLRARRENFIGARQELEAAAGLAPNAVGVLEPLATIYERMGLPRLADAAARRLLELSPTNAAAFRLLASVATPGQGNGDLLVGIEAALRRADVPLRDIARLGFAGGRLAHLDGDTDRAFALYQLGNQSRAVNDDAAGRDALAQRLANAFGALEWPEFTPRARLILLSGLPGAGQPFLADVIASHPDVVLVSGVSLLAEAAMSVQAHAGAEAAFPECTPKVSAQAWQAASNGLFARLAEEYGDAEAYVFSAPAAFLQVGVAAALAPGATIVHLERAPLAYALASYMKNYDGGAGYSYSPEGLGRLFRVSQSLSAFWASVLPTLPISVADDALASAPARITAEVLAAVGLEMHTDCDLQLEATPEKARFGDDLGLNGWRAYAAHLGPFRHALWPLGA